MGKRTTLLATVALPIVSLVWQPVQAAMIRPPVVDSRMPNVITVQEGENSESDEERKPRKKRERQEEGEQQGERRKPRKEQREESAGDQQQQERQERRKKRESAEGDDQQQQERQERRKKRESAEGDDQQQQERQERRKKQREAAEGDDQQQQDRQKAREERRKKREAAEGDEQQQQDRQKAREERRKQREAAEGDEQQQQDRQKAREERRKKREAAEGEDQQQQDRQKAREERRKKQREAAEDQQQQDRQKAREERRKKQREAAEDQQREEERAERPRRKRDENRERIARDPSKTNETIELPFIDGAAVLDSDKDFDNRKGSAREERRRKRAEERQNVKIRIPESDRDAQIGWEDRDRVRYESGERERGERRDRRPRYEERDGWRVEREVDDDRVVINFNDGIIVRSDDGRRLSRRATETYYEDLPHGRVREVIVRPNGDRVVTIRSRYGDVIQRSRIDRSGSEYVMFYAPEIDRDARPTFVDPGERLPPMRLTVPLNDYIIDTSSEESRDYSDFLERPPVEPVERVYTLDEVKYSARIRDKVRRIDLDTITFATGSSEISMNQASSLRKVAEAMNKVLDKDPGETFLIEGHTDAVGSDESNLVLSDERAEAVANVLTDVYDIPPENLATQGYGERFLKIDTDGPEQLNRRVTIRRVTPLVKPVAMAE